MFIELRAMTVSSVQVRSIYDVKYHFQTETLKYVESVDFVDWNKNTTNQTGDKKFIQFNFSKKYTRAHRFEVHLKVHCTHLMVPSLYCLVQKS